MTKFLLGLFLGICIATGLSAFAQLVPFDAPLAQQLDGQRAEAWLRNERALERMEAERYTDPSHYLFSNPCPR